VYFYYDFDVNSRVGSLVHGHKKKLMKNFIVKSLLRSETKTHIIINIFIGNIAAGINIFFS